MPNYLGPRATSVWFLGAGRGAASDYAGAPVINRFRRSLCRPKESGPIFGEINRVKWDDEADGKTKGEAAEGDPAERP